MDLTAGNLRTVDTAYSAAFRNGFTTAAPDHERFTMTVMSNTARTEYGWMGTIPGLREWVGDRIYHSLKQHDYSLVNKDYEGTLEIDRNAIEDDYFGVYTPAAAALGEAARVHPCELIYAALTAGFATACYDGQYYFDTDHPVIQADGSVASVANTDGGSGTPWFLLSTKRQLKPMIFQLRRQAQLVSKIALTDDNVFDRKTFVWGVDGRWTVGYGLWQQAWGSKQTLSASTFQTGRSALMSMKGDHGRPLGIVPDLLVVPPSLEQKANEVVGLQRLSDGSDNPHYKLADIHVSPYLA